MRVPGHRRVGVLHDANRWYRQTEAAALAVLLDSGSGKKVPPRGRGACTARTRKVCFEKNTLSATLPSSYASRPRTWWSSTMWMAPDRWQATYTRIGAMEYRPKTAGPPPPPAVLRGGPGSGGRSPVRKRYGSRPTSQTRKQAAVPPEAPVPGMQQGKRFRCTCRCTIPNAPPRAPRRPSGRWRRWSLQCRPLPAACVHVRQQKWKIWSEARTTREIGRKKKQDRELESCWKVAAGRSHTCKGSTCNNDHIQHGHMADALQSAHGSFGAWTRGKDDAQGTRQWRRRRRAWPEVTTGGIKPSGKIRVACSKEDCFVCLCANIYIYIYIYIVAIPVHECSYWGLYIQQAEDAYKARFGARASAEKEHDLVHEQRRKWARFGARRNAEKSTVWCTKKRRKQMKTARFGARRNFEKSTIWCLTPGHCFTKLELHHDDVCDEWCTVAWLDGCDHQFCW